MLSWAQKKIRKKIFKFGFPLFRKVEKLDLPNVTLIVIDCVNYERAKRALDHCLFYCNFGAAKLLTHFDSCDRSAVKIEQLRSIEAYSKFVLKDLDRYFDTDYALVAQWDGQIERPYAELSEDEKASDREQVKKYLPTIIKALESDDKR